MADTRDVGHLGLHQRRHLERAAHGDRPDGASDERHVGSAVRAEDHGGLLTAGGDGAGRELPGAGADAQRDAGERSAREMQRTAGPATHGTAERGDARLLGDARAERRGVGEELIGTGQKGRAHEDRLGRVGGLAENRRRWVCQLPDRLLMGRELEVGQGPSRRIGERSTRREHQPLESVAARGGHGKVACVGVREREAAALDTGAQRPGGGRDGAKRGLDAMAGLHTFDEPGRDIISACEADGEVVDAVVAAEDR